MRAYLNHALTPPIHCSPKAMQRVLRGRWVLFLGDSTIGEAAFSLLALLAVGFECVGIVEHSG